jgi:hypothetical protein
MSEYDEKMEEAQSLIDWFTEHEDDIKEHGDGVILQIACGEPKTTSGIMIANRLILQIMIQRLIGGLYVKEQEK